MADFVVASTPDASPTPDWVAACARRPPAGWKAEPLAPRWTLWRTASRPLGVMQLGPDDLILGDFARAPPAATLDALPSRCFEAAARDLQGQGWGAYVYLRRTPSTGALAIYRDPGGALDAAVWQTAGAALAASGLPDWLDPALPADVAIDWDVVAAFAVNPTLQTAGCGLAGVRALAPGEAWSAGVGRQLWRPADFVFAPKRPHRSDPADLADVVQDAVGRLADGPVLLEVSGGLDSAIVAGCLPPRRLAVALNYHVRDPQGDERAFARAVAARAGVSLLEVEKSELPLDVTALAAASDGLRPALNAFDHAHDADVAARCRALGVEILMTGQGGDDVFFQTPTPLVVADGLRHGLSLAELTSLARWQGRSIYGLLRDGVKGALRGPALASGRPDYLEEAAWSAAGKAPQHPWFAGLEAAAPAKAMQVAGLANALIVKGASRRSAAARLRHPLLAQPVVEHALALTVPDLTRGRDRGLARQAFATVVPVTIAQRPTKGRMSAHYGRVLAGALDELRPLLLEGRLAGAGIIRPEVLDGRLKPESLIWRAGYGAIINLTMLELWVRAWARRLDR